MITVIYRGVHRPEYHCYDTCVSANGKECMISLDELEIDREKAEDYFCANGTLKGFYFSGAPLCYAQALKEGRLEEFYANCAKRGITK